MVYQYRRTAFIVILIFVALALRLGTAVGIHQLPVDDALAYDKLAMHILSSKGFTGDDGLPTSLRPPFYSLFLTIIYFVFGHSYEAVKISQAIIGTCSVILFYLIGRRLYSEIVGGIAAIMAAVYSSYIVLTGLLLTETLFTFLLVLSVFLFLRVNDRPTLRNAIFLGMTMGFLTLTRSTAMALPLVFAAMLYFTVAKEKPVKILYIPAAVLLSFCLIIGPWVCRNTALYGRPVLISTNGGLNAYQSVSPIREKIFGMIPSDENIERASRMTNEAERDSFLFSKAIEKIIREPVKAMKFAVMRSLFYWGFFDWEVQSGKEYNYLYAFILPFFILSCVSSLKKVEASRILFVIIAYFFLPLILSQGTVRYRLPIDGYIFILGAYSMVDLYEKSKNRWAFIGIVTAYFMFNYIMFLKSETAKEAVKYLMRQMGLW